MVELHVDLPRTGDSVYGAPSELTVTVTPGLELSDALPRPVERVELRLVHNGVPLEPVSVTGYPFVYEHAITAPTTGMDRWRAEVLIDGRVRTLTSHVWVATDASQTEVNNGAPPVASMGCAAGDAASGPSVLWALGVLGVLAAGTRASRRRIG